MTKQIPDLLNDYTDSHVSLSEAPFPTAARTKELTMEKIKSSRRRSLGRFPRTAVIAAATISLLTLSVAAVGFTFWDRARSDLGITDQNIPEYTEYSINESTAPTEITFNDEESESAMGQYAVEDARIDLVSALCTGDEVTAYLSISPVTQEMADVTWDNVQGLWDMADWSYGFVSAVGAFIENINSSSRITQLEYDAESQTALLRLNTSGEVFTKATEITISLTWWHQQGEENPTSEVRYYGNVTIPITHSQSLMSAVDFQFENDFLPQFTAKVSNVEIYAGYISLTVEMPSVTEACNILGEDAYFIIGDAYRNYYSALSNQEPRSNFTELDADVYYRRSWDVSLSSTMSDTALILSDGSMLTVSKLDCTYTGWIENTPDDGGDDRERSTRIYTYDLSTPLDLSQIKAIVIGGVEYPVEVS